MGKTIEDFMQGGYDQISWPEDGTINIEYLGQEIVETQFGDRVKLVVYDLIDERETAIYTASKRLLVPLFQTLKAQYGDKFAIRRKGSGFQTKYEVVLMARAEIQPEQAITANDVKKAFPTAETMAKNAQGFPIAPATKPKKKKFAVEDAAPFE